MKLELEALRQQQLKKTTVPDVDGSASQIESLGSRIRALEGEIKKIRENDIAAVEKQLSETFIQISEQLGKDLLA